MVYKICLVSSHSAGKTSLAASTEGKLKERDVEAKYLSEKSTEAKERGLKINEKTTLEAQLWILHRQFEDELIHTRPRKNGPNYEVLICDRGVDNYCYLEHNLGRNQYALEMTLGHAGMFPYDRIYFLPIVSKSIPAGSGIRSKKKAFQEAMGTEIKAFLNEYFPDFTELPVPDKEDQFRNEWVKIVVNQTLKDLNKPEKYFMR